MMKLNNETAMRQALEIAKIVCANPAVKISPDQGSADQLLAFIETLADGFTGHDEK